MVTTRLAADEEVQAGSASPEGRAHRVPGGAGDLPELPGPAGRRHRAPRPAAGLQVRTLPGPLPPADGERPAALIRGAPGGALPPGADCETRRHAGSTRARRGLARPHPG